MRLILAVVFNSVALYASALAVPGISFTGGWGALLVAGAIMGVFNYCVRPIAVVLSLPLLVVTLGTAGALATRQPVSTQALKRARGDGNSTCSSRHPRRMAPNANIGLVRVGQAA